MAVTGDLRGTGARRRWEAPASGPAYCKHILVIAILQILQQGKRQHDDAKDYKNDTGCTV